MNKKVNNAKTRRSETPQKSPRNKIERRFPENRSKSPITKRSGSSTLIKHQHFRTATSTSIQKAITEERAKGEGTVVEEAINIEKPALQCKYGKNGCLFVVQGEEMELLVEHEISCIYKKIVCEKCEETLLAMQLYNHVKTCALPAAMLAPKGTDLKIAKGDLITLVNKQNDENNYLKGKVMEFQNILKGVVSKINLLEEIMKERVFYGVQRYMNIDILEKYGFELMYEKTYSYPTKASELESEELKGELACVGAKESGSRELVVCAFGNPAEIFKSTLKNKPNYHFGSYWYMTQEMSFGFSHQRCIDQAPGDGFAPQDPLRLSWRLNGKGGYRAAEITKAEIINLYNKVIYIQKEII